MDPIKTQGYAQAIGFNPGTAPNTAAQQKAQDDEFIRQYKESKDIELKQEATALAQLKEKNRIERESQKDADYQKEAYQQKQDEIKLNQLKRQQAAEQSVAGMNSEDKKFNDALKLVTDLSKTAIKAYTGIRKNQIEESQNKIKGIVERDVATGDWKDRINGWLGAKAQSNANMVVGFKQESEATQVGMQGNPNLEASIKFNNPTHRNYYMQVLGGYIGKSYGSERIAELTKLQNEAPDTKFVVNGEEITIGNYDLSDPEKARDILQDTLPQYLKERGLDGYSSAGLGDFYKNAITSTDQVVGALRNNEIETQKKDRIDSSMQVFRMDPTPVNAKYAYTTLTQSGMSASDARKKVWQNWTTLDEQSFRAMGEMPWGPNNMAFKDQYPGEWAQAVGLRNNFIQSKRNAANFALESGDEEQLLQIKADQLEDLQADGKFDADPATLASSADNAELIGHHKSAEYLRSLIPLTRSKQYEKTYLEGLESDMKLGIMNYSAESILSNPSLSSEAKQKALGLLKEYENTAVPKEVKTADQGIINAAIRNRAGVNTFTKGPADSSVKIMEKKAWARYRQVYAQEFKRTQDSGAAAKAALEDFYAKFGDDPQKGDYRINGKITGTESGKYVNGVITGKAYDPGIKQQEVAVRFEEKGEKVALAEPDLYTGEKDELTKMLEGANSGRISVPATLQHIQRQSGGNMSLRQLLNMRLKANGLDEIPNEVGKLADEVETAWDPRYNKYLNYQPNPIRTDIATIGSGHDPIYKPTVPNEVAADEEFQAAVLDTSKRLGINPNDLYAVISFETGGTFSPSITNAKGSGATGLIQIMPNTAKGLGTTTEALSKMSRARQMHYVEKHLSNKNLAGKGLSDIYMAVLFPAAVGKPDDYVLFGRGAMSGFTGIAYEQNAGLDKNGDGSVTKAEASAAVLAHRQPDDETSPWRQPKNIRPELLGAR